MTKVNCLASIALLTLGLVSACSTTSQGKLFGMTSDASDIRKSCARSITPLQERLSCDENVEIVISHDLNTGRFLQERLSAYTDSESADDVQSAPFVVGTDKLREVIRSEFFKSEKRVAQLIAYENATGAITCLARGEGEIAFCEHAIETLAGETQMSVESSNEIQSVLGVDVSMPSGCLKDETVVKAHIACYGATVDVQVHTSLVDAAKRLEGIEFETQAVGIESGRSVTCRAFGEDADCIIWNVAESPPMQFMTSLSTVEGKAVTVLCKAPDPQMNALCGAFIDAR